MHIVSNLQYLFINEVTLVAVRKEIELVNTFLTIALAVILIGLYYKTR